MLGLDFFRRAIVDVDIPRDVVRLIPRSSFVDPPDLATTFFLGGHRAILVCGEVLGVGRGAFTLDTGMQDNIVVYGMDMALTHPRTLGSERSLAAGQDLTESPDYAADIDGVRFAGFHFPGMPATGRDHERQRVGAGLALVGMDLMRHLRIVFDVANSRLYTAPGDGYRVMSSLGVGVDNDERGRPVLSEITPDGPAYDARLRINDRVVSVDGGVVNGARGAREALAQGLDQPVVRITVMRDGIATVHTLTPVHVRETPACAFAR